MSTRYDELLEKYYQQAADWNYDVHDCNEVAKNRYFLLVVITALTTLLSVFAVSQLTPLKQTIPYLIQVDKASGEVSEVKPLDMTKYSPPDLVTINYIARYIQAREQVDSRDQDKRFEEVQLLSTQAVANEYIDFTRHSPRSSLATFNKGETRDVYIRHVLKLNRRDAFHIEIETTDRLKSSAKPVTLYWAIVVEYRYINMPSNNKIRYDNPLGFQVTYYNKDQKVIK